MSSQEQLFGIGYEPKVPWSHVMNSLHGEPRLPASSGRGEPWENTVRVVLSADCFFIFQLSANHYTFLASSVASIFKVVHFDFN